MLLRGRRVERRAGGLTPDSLLTLLEEERPDVVAIDAPSAFAVAGRSRAAERDLSRRGIRLFFTPDAKEAKRNPWYSWMEIGIACFTAARTAGYDAPLEVFPHASAVVIRGTLPPLGSSKVRRRRAVLESQGVPTDQLRNVDEVDAALAALTGIIEREGGATSVGDPDEGLITVPTTNLLPRYTR